jgi:hypothetical protein
LQTGCEVRAHDSNIHESEQKANYKWRPSGVRLLIAFGTERIHTFVVLKIFETACLAGSPEKQTSRALNCWWARQDSNLGPTDYESAALTS